MKETNDNLEFVPLSVPHIAGREWEYVKECLDGGWVSSAGPFVDRFEKEFARYVGAKFAVACASGTAALQVALELAGVKAGEEVLVPTLTFIASVNVIKYVGAEPVFFDADDFYNIDAGKLRRFLAEHAEKRSGALFNRKSGRRIAAILPVHVFGNAVDPQIFAVGEEFSLPVVEDAAESLGTKYSDGPFKGRHTGTISRIGACSFNGNKIITTGGGGMIMTNDEALAKKAKYLTTQAKDDEVRFVHHEIGYNFRMTNVQAAIGTAQLEKIEDCVRRKSEVFDAYRKGLAGVRGLVVADSPSYGRNNHWIVGLQVDPKAYGESREDLMQRLSKKKIQTRPVWLPNHMQRPYADNQTAGVEKAVSLWERTLNLPNSVGITDEQVQRVIREIAR
ncbi:MAG TPA: LegC family aminotransferase [Bdellovibrionota bacterium]|jgi:aminotransferase in exopolysaccharide biosynthesis